MTLLLHCSVSTILSTRPSPVLFMHTPPFILSELAPWALSTLPRLGSLHQLLPGVTTPAPWTLSTCCGAVSVVGGDGGGGFAGS